MTEDNTEVDGYGNPFPRDAQERHLAAILASLYLPPEEKVEEFVQPEWKDKPAGHFERGSGI